MAMREAAVARGVAPKVLHRSEREDWVQSMILAGLGVGSLPEYSQILPGLGLRPYADPEFVRQISMVTVTGAGGGSIDRLADLARRHSWT
jgi:hypothetical protein